MTIYSATANNQTINLTQADDTVILGSYNNVTVVSYRDGGANVASNEVISLGSGTGETIEAYIGDTVLGGTGSGTALLRTYGHDDTYLIGDAPVQGYMLSSHDTFSAGNGNDIIEPEGGGTDILVTVGNGDDSFYNFGAAYSSITLGDGNNNIKDENGADNSISVGNGVNSIMLGTSDHLTAGLGSSTESDSIYLFGNYATVTVGDGANTISGDSAYHLIEVGNGNNDISAELSSTVIAGNGNDSISGGNSIAVTVGNGNDVIGISDYGTVFAGNGNDSIFASDGDTIFAGNGNDTFSLSARVTADTLYAGNGNDTVQLDQFSSGVVIALGNGDDTVNGDDARGSLSITVGVGTNTFELERYLGSTFDFSQAIGGGIQTIDLTSTNLVAANITITNRDDVIVPGGDASISTFNLTVNFDGFKAPDGNPILDYPSYNVSPTATVHYLDTTEAINSAYAKAQPLPYFIADLLFSPTPNWNSSLGHAVTLEFSFMQSSPSYANAVDQDDFQALGGNVLAGLSPSQLLADNSAHLNGVTLDNLELQAVQALASWEQIADVTFISATDGNSVPIRFGSNNQGDDTASYSYDPFVSLADPLAPDGSVTGGGSDAGNIYLNNQLLPLPSSYYQLLFAHEIGHALGMGGESGNADPFDILPGGTLDIGGGEDSGVYTVMSYNNPPGTSTIPIDTPGAFDIATIQYLYGANPNYDANSSHVWTFSSTYGSTHNLIDGLGSATDEISAGNWSGVGSIDLRQGHWSRLGAQQTDTLSGALGQPDILAADQLFIDYGTEVNYIDASHTSGAMTLVANDGDDSIVCGAGTDLVVVAAGQDTVTGGAGIDTVLFQAASTDYTIVSLGFDDYVVTADSPIYGGTDYLSGVTDLAFTDTTVVPSVTTTVVESFTATEIAALSVADIGRLTPSDVAALSTTQIDAFTTAQIRGLAATTLARLGSTFLSALSTAQIESLTPGQLLNVPLSLLGSLTPTQVAGLTTTQLAGLNVPALHGLGVTNLDAMTPAQLASLTITQLTGFNATALSGLSTTDVASLTSAQLAGLSATVLNELGAANLDQLTTGEVKLLTSAQLGGLSSTSIASLTADQVDALTAKQIATLSTGQLAGLGPDILGTLTASQLGGFSTQDIVSLTTTQIDGLSGSEIGALAITQIAALSTGDVAALGADQLAGLSTTDIVSLSTAQISVLTSAALLDLSALQIGAFTTAQLAHMSTAQYALILG